MVGKENKTWNTPEWRKASDEFLAEHPFCKWHGEPVKSQVVHHTKKCRTLEEYLDMRKGCIPLCNRCHYAAKWRTKLCPTCKERYYKQGRGKRSCWECFTKTPLGKAVKKYYEGHKK